MRRDHGQVKMRPKNPPTENPTRRIPIAKPTKGYTAPKIEKRSQETLFKEAYKLLNEAQYVLILAGQGLLEDPKLVQPADIFKKSDGISWMNYEPMRRYLFNNELMENPEWNDDL